MRRRDLFLVLGSAALSSSPVAAQRERMPLIGFLLSGVADKSAPYVASFREGLRETGFVEGQNVAIEYRWAQGQYDRLPGMAADLVARNVDVIVAGGGTPPVLAAKAATTAIPIVFANVGDPVRQGLVVSLARPGGNLTGISILFGDLAAKRVELLADLAPRFQRIGLLVNLANPINEVTAADVEGAARIRGLQIHLMNAGTASDVDAAFVTLSELRADALIVGADPFFYNVRDQLVASSSRQNLPTIYAWREFVAAGGLISYGPSIVSTYRQAGEYAGKILNGTKPADLPVQQPTKFELVINLKTAAALGLTVPQSLLARADEVIE